MSKRTSKKRKVVSQALEGSPSAKTSTIGTTMTLAAALQQPPRNLADAMLQCLPTDATMKSKDTKNLLRAFDLVRAELQHRTNRLSASCVEAGATRDVMLSGAVTVPHDVFLNVLDFLPRPETVHNVSLVSKSWLAVARAPQLWHTLDADNGLAEKSHSITNMTLLLELINRPQFASLKTLTPSDKVQLRKKALEQIAKACPFLEEIDLGFSGWSNMKLDDTDLLKIPTLFPYLTKIRFDQYKVTNEGIVKFCQLMGDRLLSLMIADSYNCDKKLSDKVLSAISRCSTKLERFGYKIYMRTEGQLTEKGVIELLRGCATLKSLSLVGADSVGLQAYEQVVLEQPAGNNSSSSWAQLDRLFVVEHHTRQLSVDNPDLCSRISAKIKSFEAIRWDEHNRSVMALRRSGRSHIFW